jgi:gamma-glutamylaminecyclotransferase
MSKLLLFVYGTLKRGQSANHLLGDAEFVRSAATLPVYQLLDLGTHPGMVESNGPGIAISGELWRISPEVIPALDAYEGAPTEYGRRPIRIQDCVEPVIAYFFLGDLSNLSPCSPDWSPRTTKS